jgi:hypothetical protein
MSDQVKGGVWLTDPYLGESLPFITISISQNMSVVHEQSTVLYYKLRKGPPVPEITIRLQIDEAGKILRSLRHVGGSVQKFCPYANHFGLKFVEDHSFRRRGLSEYGSTAYHHYI